MDHSIPQEPAPGRVRTTQILEIPHRIDESVTHDLIATGIDRFEDGKGIVFSLAPHAQRSDTGLSLSETWHDKCKELANLNRERATCRASLKLCYKHLTKEAYADLVKKHTKFITITRPEFPIRLIKTGRWHPVTNWAPRVMHSKVMRWYSKSEWIISLSLKRGVTKEQMEKYLGILQYLRSHPEADTPKYRFNLDPRFPSWTAKDSVPEDQRVYEKAPAMETVRIPIRNWSKIREIWRGKQDIADRASRPWRDKLRSVSEKIDRAYSELKSSFQVLQTSDYRLPQLRYNSKNPRDTYWKGDGFFHTSRALIVPALPAYSGEWVEKTPLWHVCETHKYLVSDVVEGMSFMDWRDRLEACAEVGTEFTNAVSGARIDISQILNSALWSGSAGRYASEPYPWEQDADFTPWYPLAPSDETLKYRKTSGPGFPNLIRAVPDEEIMRTADADRIRAWGRLRNMRVPLSRRRIKIDIYRSIGELKDTPLLWREARDFFLWLRGKVGGLTYFEVILEGGSVPHYIVADGSSLRSKIIADLSVSSKKRLILQGGQRVYRFTSIRRITGVPTLAVAAALYLSWKFGVEQSIADAHAVLENGWAVFHAASDGLERFESDVSKKIGYIFPRTRWQATSVGIPISRKSRPYTTRVSYPREEVADLFSWETELVEWIASGEPPAATRHLTSGLGVCQSEKLGLWTPYPFNGREPTLEEEREIDHHNIGVLMNAGLLHGPNVFVGRALSGTVFSRINYREFERFQRVVSTKWSHSFRPLEVAWELAPLSFIADWFTNIGERITVAQDLINTAVFKDLPRGPVWESLSDELLFSNPVHTSTATDVKLIVRGPSRVLTLSSLYEQRTYDGGTPTYWREIAGTVYPCNTNFTLIRPGSDFNVTWDGYGMRSFTRRPWAGGDLVLPPVRLRSNINAGKMLSLLALLIAK